MCLPKQDQLKMQQVSKKWIQLSEETRLKYEQKVKDVEMVLTLVREVEGKLSGDVINEKVQDKKEKKEVKKETIS